MKRPGSVVPLEDKHVSMVACGGPYTVLATDSDEVWAFGANARGQLGLGGQSSVCLCVHRWPAQLTTGGRVVVGEQSDESLIPKQVGGKPGSYLSDNMQVLWGRCACVQLPPPRGHLSWKVELIACGYAHTVFLVEDLCVHLTPCT
jgi:hypothetical protein